MIDYIDMINFFRGILPSKMVSKETLTIVYWVATRTRAIPFNWASLLASQMNKELYLLKQTLEKS